MAADAFVRPMRRLAASDAAAESRLVPFVTVAHDLVASPRPASITEMILQRGENQRHEQDQCPDAVYDF
jgi:hypothetical protein